MLIRDNKCRIFCDHQRAKQKAVRWITPATGRADGLGSLKPISRWLFCLPLIAGFSTEAHAAVITFQSAPEQTALLELYTSEGCSSCPPAETWLTQLKASPGLWKDFVPLAFHVDYWDYLGWRDPWAERGFSDRQRAYAQRWHSKNIYTPALVLNGKEWRDWSQRKDGPRLTGAKAGVLTVSSPDTNRWEVNFAPANQSAANYEVHSALLAGGLSSEVKAGENRGRRLHHDFAVLTLVTKPLIWNGEVARGDFVLSVPRTRVGSRPALAIWITEAGYLEPLQATGGWLVLPDSRR
jgi:hypothetical protein